MSKYIKDLVYKLEKELEFWEDVHKYELPDNREFELIDQILALQNCDEFGTPRYNGGYLSVCENDEDDEDDEYKDYSPSITLFKKFKKFKKCKYCGESGLKWFQTENGWRLFNSKGIHSCKNYTG